MTGEGRFRVDAHVKVLNERVVGLAKARGVDALVYAPHFVRLPDIRARAARFSDDELLVVPAREVFTGDWTNRRHILSVGLSDPVPDFITLEGALAEFERQDAAVLVPHPGYLNVGLSFDDVRRERDRIHAVEVVNPKHFPWHDERATEFVAETGLPSFASSYAHLSSSVGVAWTSFDERYEDEDALVAAFREGVPRRACRRDDATYSRQRVAELGHLAYENTWKKVDRLFLQGTEPTHPRHVAYEGRFDDVAVY